MEFESKVPDNLPVRQKGFTLTEVLFALTILSILLAVAGLLYSGYKTKVSETVVQEDLRQAYTSAMAFFIDFPQRVLSRVDLEKYGFRGSSRIETRVVDGRLASLLLVSYSTLAGSKAFMVQGLGSGFTGGKEPSGLSDGIPGVSFAGPLIQPINEIGWGRCNEKAKIELKEAFEAAQKYFAKDPGGSITKDILLDYGYLPSEAVTLLVINGAQPSLQMSAIFSVPGASTFMIDSSGFIREG